MDHVFIAATMQLIDWATDEARLMDIAKKLSRETLDERTQGILRRHWTQRRNTLRVRAELALCAQEGVDSDGGQTGGVGDSAEIPY